MSTEGRSGEGLVWMGVDPGTQGGLAVIREGGVVDARKMPATQRDMFDCVDELLTGIDRVKILVEDVHAMPKEGVKSAFTFGRMVERVQMAILAFDLNFDLISPGRWQKHFGLIRRKGESDTAKKNRHKARAQQLAPKLKVTHYVADAILIAVFCARTRRLGW